MRKATDRELENSVRAVGLLVPIVRYQGVIYDGQRRDLICRAFGIAARDHHCADLSELLQVLWLFEPMRAIKHAGKMSIADYAETFATTPLGVARFLRDATSAPKERRTAERFPDAGGGNKELRSLVQFWISHRQKYAAQLTADLTRCNLSELIRQALQEKIARELDGPTRAAIEKAILQGTEYRHKHKAVTSTPRK